MVTPTPALSATTTTYSVVTATLSQYNPIIKIFNTIFQNATFIVNQVRNIVGLGKMGMDAIYVGTGRFLKEKTFFGSIGNLLICFTDFSSLFFCLDSWKILTFARLSSVIGASQVLKPILAAPFALILNIIAAFGYVYLLIDSIYRLIATDMTKLQKRQALFDIANSIAQIALTVAFAAALTNVIGIAVLAALAAIFGVLSFFHRLHVNRETPNFPVMK